jgi:V/A-type H+-transporting ATPase subunit A
MMDSILRLYEKTTRLVSLGIPVSVIRKSGVFEELIRIKYNISNEDTGAFDELNMKLETRLDEIESDYKQN